MFPFDVDDDELDVEADDEETLRDYEINLETGKLTGRMIEGLDVIKQRINIILGTNRYIYNQYSWDHGCDLYTLIGHVYKHDYLVSEAKRMITEALSEEDYIEDLREFNVSVEKDKMTVSFIVDTIYGSTEANYDV